jgi:hypothetical protein
VALDETRLARLALASVVFACAWSFKQSSVWTFAGALLGVTLLERRFARSLSLLAPFALIAGVSLWLGGAVYRYNVLAAPALSRWHWSLFLNVGSRALPQNGFIFGFWLLVFAWECRGGARAAWQRLARADRLLICVVFTTSVFGSLAFGREGSNKNHLLEGYVACALASWSALGRVREAAPRWLGVVAALAALPLVGLPALQLASVVGLAPENRFGRTLFCSDADVHSFVEFEQALAALPHPLFVDDDVFSQPWYSTGDRYPALVLDGGWYDIARRQGLLPADFPRGVLLERGYRAAVLPVPNPVVDAFVAGGARCTDFAAHTFGFKFAVCRFDQ